jgi:NitT/TauT family transport system substrate-binding protein
MRLVRASAAASRIALASVSAAVLVSACHVPGTGGAGPAASGGGSITVAVVPGIDNAPLRVAVQDGLFQQHGLNVTVKGYHSISAEIQALKSGQADIAVGDYTDFFAAQAAGTAKLRLIADGYDAVANSTAVLTLPGSRITTPQSLSQGQQNGQPVKVATPPADVPAGVAYPPNVPWNLPMMATQQVLQSDAVSPSSVRWQPMSMQDMIPALRNGRVNAILVTEPYIFQAEAKLGAVEVLDSDSGVTAGLPLSGYFSSKSFTDSQPSTVRAFQAALSQAQGNAGMRGPVQNVLPSLVQGMTVQDAAMVTLGTYPTAVSVGQVQRVATLMSDSGMISSPIDVSSLLFR